MLLAATEIIKLEVLRLSPKRHGAISKLCSIWKS